MTKQEKLKGWISYAESFMTRWDLSLCLISFVLLALFKDLGLENAYRVSGAIFLWTLVGMLCAFITLIVCFIIKSLWKHQESKKSNIEKLIDEELRKDIK